MSSLTLHIDTIHPLPTHIGIIIDGNGRWAQARGLPRLAGHKAGADNIRRILMRCVDHGVKVLTIYGFSTENWHRPPPRSPDYWRWWNRRWRRSCQLYTSKGCVFGTVAA